MWKTEFPGSFLQALFLNVGLSFGTKKNKGGKKTIWGWQNLNTWTVWGICLVRTAHVPHYLTIFMRSWFVSFLEMLLAGPCNVGISLSPTNVVRVITRTYSWIFLQQKSIWFWLSLEAISPTSHVKHRISGIFLYITATFFPPYYNFIFLSSSSSSCLFFFFLR